MKVLIGIPTAYGDMRAELFHSLKDASKEHEFDVSFCQSSFTPYNFNQLWCKALNNRDKYTHFCIIHTDLSIEAYWLDKMMTIMKEKEADVLGVVIPIKTNEGATSTAIDGEREPSHPDYDKDFDKFRVKRFSMKEIYNFAPTFSYEKLLVNSGCMLIDFRKPWVEKIVFSFADYIFKTEQGFAAKSIPEDWKFCKDALKLGVKIWATREIFINHIGGGVFPNNFAWGK